MGDSIRREHRFTVTPEHLILDPRVSDRAMRLWCRLDRFAGNRDSTTSYRETLSVELDCSLASVDRALTELVESGWLRKERTPGGANIYTLVVAPQKTVERLVERARKERLERWGNQRRKPASSQVTGGAVLTSDDTPGRTVGVVTHDDRVSSPMTTGVVTHDAQEEASTKEATGDAPAPAADAAPATPDGALFVVQGAVRVGKDRPHRQAAHDLATAWYDALPYPPNDAETFRNVRRIIEADLNTGRPSTDVSFALTECGVAVTRKALDVAYNRCDKARAGQGRSIRSQGFLTDPDADFGMPGATEFGSTAKGA
jgi:hypothetical protein